jgi:hypothetical protein
MTTEKKNNRKTRRFGLRGGLMIAAILTTTGLVVGCGGGGGGGGGGVCEDGFIEVSWDVLGNPPGCLTGETVDVEVDNVTMIDHVACTDMDDLTPGVAGDVVHTLTLTLYDGGGNPEETSPTITVPVSCGETAHPGTYDFNP